jgi:hypothetical protein
MVSRRELLSGGVLSLAGAGAVAPREATGVQDVDLEPVLKGLEGLRTELAQYATGLAVSRDYIGQLRRIQKQHFRTNGRFPAWIDVGIDVFESVYDWYIRNQQPLTVTREAPGRFTIPFFFSTIIGRPDVEPNYISMPYDER